MPLPGKRHFVLTIPGSPTRPPTGKNQIVSFDEMFTGEIGQVGTQFDGLGHIGVHIGNDNIFYNGNKLSEFGSAYGLKKLGVEHAGPFVTRGVLLDVAGVKEMRNLPGGYALADPATATVLGRFAPAMHFRQMVSSDDGVYVYGLDVGDNAWKTVRIVKLEAATGQLIAERTLEPDVWYLTSGTLAR